MGFFSALGETITGLFRAEDADMRLIRLAAEGAEVDMELLGKAYWRKYHGTYVPPAQWHGMPRAGRDAVYRERMKLKACFSHFTRAQQDWARDMRPKRPADWPPKRTYGEAGE